MKKLTSLILALAMTALMLGGCSGLFTSGSSDDKGSSDGSSSGPIKITGSYTYEDPADLDFDSRYVLCCDENNPEILSMADSGLKCKYMIIYGKDGKSVGHYEMNVYDTAENAQGYIDEYGAFGRVMTAADEDPTVVFDIQVGDELEAAIMSYVGFGMMSDDSVESYVQSLCESWSATVQ